MLSSEENVYLDAAYFNVREKFLILYYFFIYRIRLNMREKYVCPGQS